jgi:hypothetical protein
MVTAGSARISQTDVLAVKIQQAPKPLENDPLENEPDDRSPKRLKL